MRPCRSPVLALLACLACSSAHAQTIKFDKEVYQEGEPIVGRVTDFDAKDASMLWTARQIVVLPGGIEVQGMAKGGCLPVGDEAHFWGKSGVKYSVELLTAVIENGKAVPKTATGTFSVGGVPNPTPNPTPNPQPDPRPNPNPPPGSLAALVPDPAHRALLAEFYGDLAAAVRAGQFASTAHFREGYRKAIEIGKANGTLPQGLAAINKPVSDRIVAAITLADTPFDEAKKNALAVCLEGIAAEFKG